ncbi:MAG: glycoside hydrolase family 5 protein [Bdellovibrionales bacterium]|nr:glycoside hydrolase family 5 protein [Bdellovibrionales bacterium]
MKKIYFLNLISTSIVTIFLFHNCSPMSGIKNNNSTEIAAMQNSNLLSQSSNQQDIFLHFQKKISIKNRDSKPLFFNGENSPFAPRGVNYVRLNSKNWHSLFDPQNYSPEKVQSDLIAIKNSGYNYVRVFLSSDYLDNGFGLKEPEVSEEYVNLVVDFLLRSQSLGLYVILTGQWLPKNYNRIANESSLSPQVEGENSVVLHPEYATALAQFYTDLLKKIKSSNEGLLNNIFAIDIFNEASIRVDLKPFSLKTGVIDWKGFKFDMQNLEARQQLIDQASVDWFNTVSLAIKKIDQDLLVTVSQFTPKAIGREGFDGVRWLSKSGQDPRYPLRTTILMKYSSIDFVDIHSYPESTSNFDEDLSSAQINKNISWSKPIVLGEFGAAKERFPQKNSAVNLIKSILSLSCNYNISGWGYWTWNTLEQKGPSFWTLAEEGGAFNGLLAPVSLNTICGNQTDLSSLNPPKSPVPIPPQPQPLPPTPSPFSEPPPTTQTQKPFVPVGEFKIWSMTSTWKGWAVFYSNGKSYCNYSSPESYSLLTGKDFNQNLAQIKVINWSIQEIANKNEGYCR